MRPLVTSQISVVHHVLLASPRCAELHAPLRDLLLTMDGEADTRRILEGLGLTGWESQDPESTEFMIDLMDTLMR